MRRKKIETVPVKTGPSEAEIARKRSEERLQEVQDNWPAVRTLSASLRALRTENHFAERYQNAHN